MKLSLWIPLVLGLSLALGCATKPQPESPSADSSTGAQASAASPGATSPQTPAAAPKTKAPRSRTDTPPKPDISCLRSGDSRVLEIEEVHAGCWLFYVNRGIKKRIAWSKTGNAHCEKVRDQIRTSLEKGGYQCKWVE